VRSDPPRAPVRASRLRRRERERRRRGIELLVTIVVVVLGTAYASTQVNDDGDAVGGSGRTPQTTRTQALLALSITGAPKPLLAIVGDAGSPPAVMSVPQGLRLAVPGAGELTTRQVADLAGPGLRVALSNLVGAWAAHYAVTDLSRLVALFDRKGGLRVQLPDPVSVGDGVLGPGDVTMTGGQVADYLGAEGQNTFTRWEIVLNGILAAPPTLQVGDLVETDDLGGVQATLDGAKGGRLETLPVQVGSATVRTPDYGALDRLMADRFGVRRTPVPVIVQNAVGVPGIGQRVGSLLIPKGFRVALSQNAVSFGQERTRVIALGEDNLSDARRVRAALGVGRIAVSQVPSGFGDVQIEVGEDFTA